MAEMSLVVEKREQRGKGPAGRLRRTGRIPGILYGDGKDAIALALDPKGIDVILKTQTGVNSIFDLEMSGTSQRRPVMIHGLQRNPVTHKITHADFVRVNLDKKIEVRVHVELTGLADGVKNGGGILEFPHRQIQIECLPGDIPAKFVVDVTALKLHEAIRVEQLAVDRTKIRVLDDPTTVIALVSLPAAEEAAVKAEETPEAAAAAPAAGAAGAAAPAGEAKGKAADAKGKAPDTKGKGPEAKSK